MGPRSVGSADIVARLREAQDDPHIAAVVLRVDSPGGSAFASDEIRRAVDALSRQKPVVASLGGVAASGGYYVAAAADAIYAEPETITGSIGAFAQKLSFGDLADKVGVHTVLVERGRHADLWSSMSPWDDEELAHVQTLIDDVYAQFKHRVAEGRNLSEDEVEAVARGRVWSGRRAATNGLVDKLGGLTEAIAEARRRAGLPRGQEGRVVTLAPDGDLLDAALPTLLGSRLRQELGLDAAAALLEPLAVPLWMAQNEATRVWALDARLLGEQAE